MIFALKAKFKRLERKHGISDKGSLHPPESLKMGYDDLGDFALSSDSDGEAELESKDNLAATLKPKSLFRRSTEKLRKRSEPVTSLETSPPPALFSSPTSNEGKGTVRPQRRRKGSIFGRLRKSEDVAVPNLGNMEGRREKNERSGVYAWMSNRL